MVYFLDQVFQFLDHFVLVGRDHIFGRKSVFNVNGVIAFFQIADMTITRFYGKIFSKIFFNRLCLGRRLNYEQIFWHRLGMFF